MNSIDATTCLSLYKTGRLIRRTQEILIEEYVAKQEMRCPMHFCIGQEGAPTALSVLLRADDYIVSHYRSHGYYLAKGAPLKEMIAEFHGKATGSNSGFAGSMELAHEEARIYSGAIVGGPIAIAMGVAFALKYRKAPGLVIAVVGDGSLDEGVSYEALNMAALHGVPLLTICENNLYAAHTPEPLRTMSRSITDRVKAFGMHTERLDGMDVVKLHLQLRAIVEEIRSGGAPRFVEIETYRFNGHVGPENDDWLEYRTADEIAAWRRRDPLPPLRLDALRLGISEATLRDCEAAIESEITDALTAARADEFPDFHRSLDQVWAQSYSPIVKEFWRGGEDAFDSRQAETRLKPY
jgi:TPP-dependent pyruvate/acetoin dehydrogenase alpha subunit